MYGIQADAWRALPPGGAWKTSQHSGLASVRSLTDGGWEHHGMAAEKCAWCV